MNASSCRQWRSGFLAWKRCVCEIWCQRFENVNCCHKFRGDISEAWRKEPIGMVSDKQFWNRMSDKHFWNMMSVKKKDRRSYAFPHDRFLKYHVSKKCNNDIHHLRSIPEISCWSLKKWDAFLKYEVSVLKRWTNNVLAKSPKCICEICQGSEEICY